MILLPIVTRELRVTSRRGVTYWTRFTAGLLAIVVGSFAWAMFFRKSPRDTGLALFIALSAIAYIYSLLAGALSTADCVSEEKREGTLGLLFLTDLKSYDIVLGKLVASSLTAIYGLLAIFPVMGVPLLLGGVAPAEFWRVVLVCLNNLFFSLTLGLLCSTICKDERKAIGLTVGLIILITGGWPGIVAWVASDISRANPLYHLFHEEPFPLLAISPGFTCVMAFDEPYKAVITKQKIDWFLISLGIIHWLAWSCLALTTFILPRIWHDKAASARTVRRREKWKTWLHGGAEARAAFRRRLLEINPFYWLASRDRFKAVLVWLWIGGGALLWLLGLIDQRRNWLDEGVYIWTALIVHSLFKCWLPIEASRRFGADRRSGALELLLCTPLSVREILRGQWLALLRQFGAAVALVCAVDFIFLGLGLKRSYGQGDRDLWIAVWLAGILIFVFDLITLALVSMWGSLRSRKGAQAGLSAIVRVCVVPWFLFGAFGAAVAILEEVFHIRVFRGVNDTGSVLVGIWFAISFVNNLLLAMWSLRNLDTQFRAVAMQRTESRGMFWRRWLNRKAAAQQ